MNRNRKKRKRWTPHKKVLPHKKVFVLEFCVLICKKVSRINLQVNMTFLLTVCIRVWFTRIDESEWSWLHVLDLHMAAGVALLVPSAQASFDCVRSYRWHTSAVPNQPKMQIHFTRFIFSSILNNMNKCTTILPNISVCTIHSNIYCFIYSNIIIYFM